MTGFRRSLRGSAAAGFGTISYVVNTSSLATRFARRSCSEKECFSAALYTCYDLVSPDVALELAWLHSYTDDVLPYFIQHVKNSAERISALEVKLEKSESKAEEAEAYGQNGLAGNGGMLMIGYGGDPSGGYGGAFNNGGGVPMNMNMGPQMGPQGY